jgi:hypothetical protein
VKANQWTAEEDAILERYYPIEGMAVAERLKHRTPNAVQQHASNLGLRLTPEARKARGGRPKRASTKANARAAHSPVRPAAVDDQARRAAESVPDSALGMPWVQYPKTVDDCRGIITRCTYVLDEFGVNMSAGERAYFESSRKYARATLERLEASEHRVN